MTWTWIRNSLHFLISFARELADESAYQRYLAHSSRSDSSDEWRRFIDARLSRKYRQGKCC